MASCDADAEVQSEAEALIETVQIPVAERMANLAEAMMKATGMVATAQVIAEAACSLIPGVEDSSVSLARRGVGIDATKAGR